MLLLYYTFLLCICYKKFAQAADIPVRFASTRMARAVGLLLFTIFALR